MDPSDFALSKEEILKKYPKGSPDYPEHADGCGCSGCHASWCEWRGGYAAFNLGVQEGERRAAAEKGMPHIDLPDRSPLRQKVKRLQGLLVREQLPCNDCENFATWSWNHEYAMCDKHVPEDRKGWHEVAPEVRELIEGKLYLEGQAIANALEKK